MRRNILLTVSAVMVAFPVVAQQSGWERSLTIEGQYNPNTGKESKLLPLPEFKQSVLPQVKVDYLTVEPAMSGLEPRSMKVLSRTSGDPEYPAFDGYASLGYGLHNVTDGDAGLSWRFSKRDRLVFNAVLDGYNARTDGWRQHLLNTRESLSYTHSFDRFDLTAFGTLDYSHRNFKRGLIGEMIDLDEEGLMQHSWYGIYGVYAQSKADAGIQWTFGFSHDNLERRGLTIYEYTPDNNEMIFRVRASAAVPFDFGVISVKYSQKSINRNWTGMYGYVYDNFSTFTLTPEWKSAIGGVRTSFGANFDFRSIKGEAFMFSPEINAEYDIDSQFTAWGRLNGGLEEHSMYSLASISPYWSEYRPIRDGYTLARFESGLRYSLPSVLTAGARLGMRYTRNEIFQVVDRNGRIVTTELHQDNTGVMWTGFDVAWAMDSRFDAKAALELYSWTGNHDAGLLAYKPVAVAQLFGHACVYPGVDVSAQYNWQRFASSGGRRQKAINELELRADWQISDDLSMYMKAANLFGNDFQYWAGYRALKPYVQLGATVKF